jgi:hypothetical protein
MTMTAKMAPRQGLMVGAALGHRTASKGAEQHHRD